MRRREENLDIALYVVWRLVGGWPGVNRGTADDLNLNVILSIVIHSSSYFTA